MSIGYKPKIAPFGDDKLNERMGHFNDLSTGLDQFVRDSFYKNANPFNLKYPQTVGEDFNNTVNYNTNQSSEYAKARMDDPDGIKHNATEPFVFFEFMEVTPSTKLKSMRDMAQRRNRTYSNLRKERNLSNEFEKGFLRDATVAQNVQTYYALNPTDQQITTNANESPAGKGISNTQTIKEAADEAAHNGWLTAVNRQYHGSIAMYMPTDIQINDSIIYNENTRKTFGIITGAGEAKVSDLQDVGARAAATAAGTGFGKLMSMLSKVFSGKMATMVAEQGTSIGTIIGAGGSSVVSDERQRNFGKASNPHDYMAYQSTAMRTFTYTFTFLPDSSDESNEVTRIIKEFRSAAHAKRDTPTLVDVPSHVIVTHHGAGDMIQLPPLVIESVNVTYNPNNSSFFMENNNPVEVAMSVTLREIVPIYMQDVEAGY